MFERVLTATDLLDACDVAVITALEIAKRENGKLFVLHVLEPTYFHECGPLETVKNFKTGEETAASPEYREAVKNELDQKCAGALKPYGNYEILISYGRPSVEVRRWSRKSGADLVVLGAHAGKIEEGFIGNRIGNTVEDIIMHSTVPTMVVNRLVSPDTLRFKTLMVCIDFSQSCRYAVEFAMKMASKYGSRLVIFHLIPQLPTGGTGGPADRRALEQKLQEFCRIEDKIPHEFSIAEGTHPSTQILHIAREKNVDLIVMGSHTSMSENTWYVGSVVDAVSAQSLCPVIVVTHPELFAKAGT
jgi:nucleotide-binding universal stress UspA family protein